jgi:hypothetical protein
MMALVINTALSRNLSVVLHKTGGWRYTSGEIYVITYIFVWLHVQFSRKKKNDDLVYALGACILYEFSLLQTIFI